MPMITALRAIMF